MTDSSFDVRLRAVTWLALVALVLTPAFWPSAARAQAGARTSAPASPVTTLGPALNRTLAGTSQLALLYSLAFAAGLLL
jgi:hypothetical protein